MNPRNRGNLGISSNFKYLLNQPLTFAISFHKASAKKVPGNAISPTELKTPALKVFWVYCT